MPFLPARSPSLVCALLGLCAALTLAAAESARPWPGTPPFRPLTSERLASLPPAEQPAWQAYLERSAAHARAIPPRPAFVPPSTQPLDAPGSPSKHSRGLPLAAPAEWYAQAEALAIADRILTRQTTAGGWAKGQDYTRDETKPEPVDVWSGGTLDNDATTSELRFLALTITAAPEHARAGAWREAFGRGLQYLFDAQYPNGGFPQIYPLAGGYHDAITFNDDALVQAVEVLHDVARRQREFAFVSAEMSAEAGRRVTRAVDCILATQGRNDAGRRTAWGQQHDAITLLPCAARNFEPVGLSALESAALVRFLMTLPEPSAEVVEAVKGAITWFARTAQRDVVWSRQTGGGRLVARPGSPLLWARLYEIGTDRPIFGDRDRTVHYDVAELSAERRAGYAWYGTWPVAAIEAYRAWPAKSR